jgi:hypothetical protein
MLRLQVVGIRGLRVLVRVRGLYPPRTPEEVGSAQQRRQAQVDEVDTGSPDALRNLYSLAL